MTQPRLASQAGCSLHTVQRIEAGQGDRVAFGTVCRICDALGINVYADFAWEPEPPSEPLDPRKIVFERATWKEPVPWRS